MSLKHSLTKYLLKKVFTIPFDGIEYEFLLDKRSINLKIESSNDDTSNLKALNSIYKDISKNLSILSKAGVISNSSINITLIGKNLYWK